MDDPKYNIFPQINPVIPAQLRSVIDEIISKSENMETNYDETIWNSLLEKLLRGSSLRMPEYIKIARHADWIPPNLKEEAADAFSRKLDQKTYDKCIDQFFSRPTSESMLRFLTHTLLTKYLHSSPAPEIIKTHPNTIHKAGLPALASILLQTSEQPLSSLSESGIFIKYPEFGQQLLLELVDNRDGHILLHNCALDVQNLQTLSAINFQEALFYWRRLAQHYIEFVEGWQSLLSVDSGIATFAKYISSFDDSILQRYSPLFEIVKEFRKQRRALDELYRSDPERALFWQNILPMCTAIYTRTNLRDPSVSIAVAFQFKKIVIVEFAPIGAAYVYDTDVFRLNIRQKNYWKDKSNSLPVRGFSEDGRLLHMGDWQLHFERTIKIGLSN